MAASAAILERPSPAASPVPIIARPMSRITDFTSVTKHICVPASPAAVDQAAMVTILVRRRHNPDTLRCHSKVAPAANVTPN